MLLYIWLIFPACLCASSLSWAFLLTEKEKKEKEKKKKPWSEIIFLYWLNCSQKMLIMSGRFP